MENEKLGISSKTLTKIIEFIQAKKCEKISDLLSILELEKQNAIKIEQQKENEKLKNSVDFSVSAHQYKAGKAWVCQATENWGVSGKFMNPTETIRDGYETTKHFKLPNGKYIAETIGSKSSAKRIRLEIVDNVIVKQEEYWVK